ncbi:hypothetical protein F3Y22_tig00110415pilonHSYRG00138 [Hibiscus syriacus]|uniref:Uncharacterized protein n=1 Tax=Hibiscus syriacus TaxID=106335 RepID=A0A6A3AMS2_HIBSY|nr:hypothetical protein F3Y22_tig00110415pilonHSYRG00138 [Hibiscus syriacus]
MISGNLLNHSSLWILRTTLILSPSALGRTISKPSRKDPGPSMGIILQWNHGRRNSQRRSLILARSLPGSDSHDFPSPSTRGTSSLILNTQSPGSRFAPISEASVTVDPPPPAQAVAPMAAVVLETNVNVTIPAAPSKGVKDSRATKGKSPLGIRPDPGNIEDSQTATTDDQADGHVEAMHVCGNASSSRPSLDFQNLLFNFGLRDMGFQGPRYTWSLGLVSARLDRVICNNKWDEQFPYAAILHLLRMRSDHRPLLLSVGATPTRSGLNHFWYFTG